MASVLLAVSIDLDEAHHYRAIHGKPQGERTTVVHTVAVARLADWARQRRVPLTWFAVGQDIERPEFAEAAARLASAGDELACHSFSHPYDLTRRSFAEMRLEVERGVAVAVAHVITARRIVATDFIRFGSDIAKLGFAVV